MSSKQSPTFNLSDHNFLLISHRSHPRSMAIPITPFRSDNFSNILATSARANYDSRRNINICQRPVTCCLRPTTLLSKLLPNSLII
jgi:hypothetical protein